MKRFITTLAVTLITAFGASAQITEGHLKYKIDVSSDEDDPQLALYTSMMQGFVMDVFFSQEGTRIELSMGVGVTADIVTVVDIKSEDVLMLMGEMMGKKAVATTISEINEANGKERTEMDVSLTDETKEIAGYECKKVLTVDEDGNEITYWYTEEIVINMVGQHNFNNKIPGGVMEFQLDKNGMVMTYTVVEVSEGLDKSPEGIFSTTIPEGYDEISLDDFQNTGI